MGLAYTFRRKYIQIPLLILSNLWIFRRSEEDKLIGKIFTEQKMFRVIKKSMRCAFYLNQKSVATHAHSGSQWLTVARQYLQYTVPATMTQSIIKYYKISHE
jgi:hypothetical protein